MRCTDLWDEAHTFLISPMAVSSSQSSSLGFLKLSTNVMNESSANRATNSSFSDICDLGKKEKHI